MNDDSGFWFPAKRYGWGWGPPVKWQGWLVIAVYVAAILFICVRFPPNRDIAAFLVLVVLTTLGMVFVCWWKGEPPKWRWGDKDAS